MSFIIDAFDGNCGSTCQIKCVFTRWNIGEWGFVYIKHQISWNIMLWNNFGDGTLKKTSRSIAVLVPWMCHNFQSLALIRSLWLIPWAAWFHLALSLLFSKSWFLFKFLFKAMMSKDPKLNIKSLKHWGLTLTQAK